MHQIKLYSIFQQIYLSSSQVRTGFHRNSTKCNIFKCLWISVSDFFVWHTESPLDFQCKICIVKSCATEDSGKQCPCMGEPVSLYLRMRVCVKKGVFQLIQQMQSNLSDDACEVTDIFSLPCQMHTNAVHPTGRTSTPRSLSRRSCILRSFCTHYLCAPSSVSLSCWW